MINSSFFLNKIFPKLENQRRNLFAEDEEDDVANNYDEDCDNGGFVEKQADEFEQESKKLMNCNLFNFKVLFILRCLSFFN
jgi:hypothetical protein